MSVLDKSAYLVKYNDTGSGLFKDQTNKEIVASRARTLVEDTKDSTMFIQDNFIDEDSFATNSATRVPSQQSVKAYVDAQIEDTLIHASATITATQITNSFTSPVTLATAPGGFIPILIGPVWAVKTYVGAVFATNTNSRVSVGGQQSASLTDMMTNGSDARQLVDVTTGVNVNAYSGGDSIVFRTLIGNPTGGGTSTVTIYFSYKLSPI
jgi:hypothetical protein